MAKAIKTAPRKAPAKTAEAPAKPAPVRVTAPAPVPGSQPAMRILAQYTKDLSFENPNAPASMTQQQKQPEINISVNVNALN